MPNSNLDQIDIAILKKLQKNGRLSNVQLADAVGLSESACLRRVKLLEESGIINRYVMLINQAAIGKPDNVFVMVTLEGQQREKLAEFENEVSRVPEIMECYLMAGEFDYLLRVISRDKTDYARIHNKLTSLPGVMRVQSSFSLKTVMERTEMPLELRSTGSNSIPLLTESAQEQGSAKTQHLGAWHQDVVPSGWKTEPNRCNDQACDFFALSKP